MFSVTPLSLFPEKTLCLTFDDGPGETVGNGPGPKTLKIATFLRDEQITATFFVVGKHVTQYPAIIPELKKLGHIIGNHTFNHPSLPDFLQQGGNIVAEFADTEKLISPYLPGKTVYFRAPFGDWSPEVAQHLNKYLASASNYKGPYNWNIDAGDWQHWEDGASAQNCAENYLNAIAVATKGIVLMHDSTANSNKMKENNLTFETLKILIPQLKKQQYKFIGIDEIPTIKKNLFYTCLVAIKNSPHKLTNIVSRILAKAFRQWKKLSS